MIKPLTTALLALLLSLPAYAQNSVDDYVPVAGPAQKERKALLEKIRKAKAKKIGVSAYFKFFQSIEQRAESGASEESIIKEVERIDKGLSAQVGYLGMPSMGQFKVDLSTYPITNYVNKVEKLVNKNFRPIGNASNRCFVIGTISTAGKLVLPTPKNKGNTNKKMQQLFVSELTKVKVFPKPPKGPVRVSFSLEPSGKEIEAVCDKKINYDLFMIDMQRRIKRAWYPPKTNRSLSASVRFKLAINGKTTNVVIKKSSGNSAFDASLLKAIKAASPLRSLPDGAPVVQEIDFDFNKK